jgi:hypothetical protein
LRDTAKVVAIFLTKRRLADLRLVLGLLRAAVEDSVEVIESTTGDGLEIIIRRTFLGILESLEIIVVKDAFAPRRLRLDGLSSSGRRRGGGSKNVINLGGRGLRIWKS